jgi:hypothetical protein
VRALVSAYGSPRVKKLYDLYRTRIRDIVEAGRKIVFALEAKGKGLSYRIQ